MERLPVRGAVPDGGGHARLLQIDGVSLNRSRLGETGQHVKPLMLAFGKQAQIGDVIVPPVTIEVMDLETFRHGTMMV
jgi:hypothetical protein